LQHTLHAVPAIFFDSGLWEVFSKERQMLKAYGGITDRSWFEFLRSRDDVDKVNFWQPSGRTQFRAIGIQQQLVVLGSMSLGGSIIPVENLAEFLQVAFDAGAKRLLLQMASVRDIPLRASKSDCVNSAKNLLAKNARSLY
jgi:hypothetical protein